MPTSTDSLYLRINQVPRCRDLAILVVTTDRQTNQLLYPCACARGNNTHARLVICYRMADQLFGGQAMLERQSA